MMVFAQVSVAEPTEPAPDRPHIALFIADDLSWHDVGPYGARDVRTPHVDRLATQSLRGKRRSNGL